MTATDLLTRYPVLVAILALVMRAGLAWQSELSWYEYRTLHGLKRLLFPRLEGRLPVGLVNEKGGREDAEFITTLSRTPRQVVSDLRAAGGTLHLIASVKRRPAEYGDPLTRAHIIFTEGNDQTEAYLFKNSDGTTDVYAHYEPSPSTPLEHLGGDQQDDGDPKGVVRAALA